MKTFRLLAAACFVVVAASAWADNSFEALRGKMREGLYEYKVEMDMGQVPGMPAGMAKHNMSFQNCLTAEDIGKGRMGRSGGDSKTPQDCDVKNFKMSGNSASYTMVCKGKSEMTADNNITLTADGYKMDTNMVVGQEGRKMNMTQHLESRYLGPCNK